jgi:hypothetical protein
MAIVRAVRSLRTFTKTEEDPVVGAKRQSLHAQITIPAKIARLWVQDGVKAVIVTYDTEKPYELHIVAVPSTREKQGRKQKPDNPIDLIEEYEV